MVSALSTHNPAISQFSLSKFLLFLLSPTPTVFANSPIRGQKDLTMASTATYASPFPP